MNQISRRFKRVPWHGLQLALVVLWLGAAAGAVHAEVTKVYPVYAEGFTQSLNGEWAFKYIPSLDAGKDADFYKPGTDVSSWKTIKVPANWELEGFAEPKYEFDLKDGLGLYRRTFHVPAAWRDGRRVILRFEGVAFGFQAWVNGKKVGESSAGAFLPNSFDITDALNPNAENVLAVEVMTKPKGFEFDINDDWALSGIYRDVTLFSVPEMHVQEIATSTKLQGGVAELSVSVTVNQRGAGLRGQLLDPAGQSLGIVELKQQSGNTYEAVVKIKAPQLWTTETPLLYTLRIGLGANGKPLQQIEERIGLREISIKDKVLLLNGRPIKLRGANHHDLDPETGRAITEAQMRRDLQVMKAANMNFLRTSHYAPNRRLIELCDELGFYVMDEVAIGKGEEHQGDPAYRDQMLERTRATIRRDRNHPSIIVWSIGNENDLTDLLEDAGRLAKQLDPSRPICYPMSPHGFDKEWNDIPEFADIYAPHYPTNQRLREYVAELDRPVILTEFSHALGLATGRVQDQWDLIQQTPHFAGAAIWHLMDQGIVRTSLKAVNPKKSTKFAWIDETRYYDTYKDFGQDGIVYSDRSPQTDFWEVRKVFSLVQIRERQLNLSSGTQSVELQVENRFDFRSLQGFALVWKLTRNAEMLQSGSVPLNADARETEAVTLKLNIPTDDPTGMLALALDVADESGNVVYSRSLRLDTEGGGRKNWIDALSTDALEVQEDEQQITVMHPGWKLCVQRATGQATLQAPDGRVLIEDIFPHAGRKLTLSEHYRHRGDWAWRMIGVPLKGDATVSVAKQDGRVKLSVSGRYENPGNPAQGFDGGYVASITPDGMIRIDYDYSLKKVEGFATELGLSLEMADAFDEFRWIGQGPYAGYPGKDRLNEFGLFHLNRADLYFQGNRREVECAALTTADGKGIALFTDRADVAVERDGDKTLLKHNALIAGLGTKISKTDHPVDLSKHDRFSGQLVLLPLSTEWPAHLVRWFGELAPATNVYQPFYHSYEQ